MIHIFAMNMRNLDSLELLFDELISYVSVGKQEKIKRFHRKEDAWRTLLADLMIRTKVCADLSIINREIEFVTNEYGKPSLKNYPEYHFNISHSGNWIVCATGNCPLGIDIEYIQPIDLDVAKRFFSQDEYEDLMRVDSINRLSYFYELWTLKESYIKAVGEGLHLPLNSFYCRVCKDGTIQTGSNINGWFFKQYSIDKSYKMSVCAGEGIFSKEIKVISPDELYNRLAFSFEP